MKSTKKPVLLIVLDGWGYREDPKNNAIAASRTPTFDSLWKSYPHSLLKASGDAVGLPEGQMGNSEVGHMTIGGGSPADTDLVRINKAIASGEFEQNPALLSLFAHVKKFNSTLHITSLVSDGGVHSHQNHLYAFLKLAKKHDVPKVAVHVFTDGRDTPAKSGSGYLRDLEAVLAELGPNFFIATISGRYYAMDRDSNWDRLAKVEAALFECKGNVCTVNPSAFLADQYAQGEQDEHMPPAVCSTPDGLGCKIQKNDAIFFTNFRADRARMISEKILGIPKTENILYVTLTEYSTDFTCAAAFPPVKTEVTLGSEVSKAGFTQARIAETEKFPHATYYLSCMRNEPYPGQTNIGVASRKDVKIHDEAPEMRAEEVANKTIEQIEAGTDFMFINFANPDVVGHTANVPAIIVAVETVDTQLGRIIEALQKKGGVALVIADHGNAEVNVDPETGLKHTAHTTNLVPCIVTDTSYSIKNGGLADVAPTILKLLGLNTPKEMTGKPLI